MHSFFTIRYGREQTLIKGNEDQAAGALEVALTASIASASKDAANVSHRLGALYQPTLEPDVTPSGRLQWRQSRQSCGCTSVACPVGLVHVQFCLL